MKKYQRRSPPNHQSTARQTSWQAWASWSEFYKSQGAFEPNGLFGHGARKFEADHALQPANQKRTQGPAHP